MLKKSSLINAILNVQSDEWSTVITAWLLRFFYFFGYILGWTILTALFVSRFGVEKLPLLYIFNAGLVMLSTFYFTKLVRFFSNSELINLTLLLGAGLLFAASFLINISTGLFIAAILLANSIFLAQLEIFIFSFTEDLFTPLEAERLFPIIESGELLGAVLGGLSVTFLSHIFPPQKLIFFWILALLSISAIIYFLPHEANSLPRLTRRHTLKNKASHELTKTTDYIKSVSFLSKLAVIVGLFWMLFYLVQFQFTYFITENVRAALQPGQSLESALTAEIGKLEAMLHTTGFIVQFFIAGRLISSIGTIKSLLIQPVLSIAGGLAVLIYPGFITAFIARNNLEIGRSTHLNAYHNTFYAVRHSMRNQVREYFEGYTRQIGIIVGMVGLLIFQFTISSIAASYQLNLSIVIIALVSIFLVIKAKPAYTSYARSHITSPTSSETQKSAISILLQNGHTKEYDQLFTKDLIKILSEKTSAPEVKVEALKLLTKIQNPKALSSIVAAISDKSRDVRTQAVHSLSIFNKKSIKPDTLQKIVERLEDLAISDAERETRIAAIRSLIKLSPRQAKSFISNAITRALPNLSDYIYAASLLKSPEIIPSIKPFLSSDSTKIKSSALISLWQLSHNHEYLNSHLAEFLNPKSSQDHLTLINILSKINYPAGEKILTKYLNSKNSEHKRNATFALAKKLNPAAIPTLANYLSDPNSPDHQVSKQLVRTLPHKFQRRIHSQMHTQLTSKVRDIITKSGVKFLEDLSKNDLLQLKYAYAATNDHQALIDIEHLMQQQKNNA